MIDWLYRTSLEVSLLIGLVLILRPIVRRYLGAQAAYWLWLIPLIRCVMWSKPELPAAIMEKVHLPTGETLLRIFPNPDQFIIPANFPVEWIWLTGFLLWVSARFVGWRQLNRCLTNNSNVIKLPETLNDYCQSILNKKGIIYFQTGIEGAPFVTGLLNPKVFLPRDFFEQYSQVQQQCILAHELTHLKRQDLWLQIIGELTRAIFWFNPVVHIAWTAFREDQELACDYHVLRHSDDNERYEYGRALVKGFHSHVLPATLAFFTTKNERFIMLEKHKNSLGRNILGIALCGLIGIFTLTKAPSAIASESSWPQEPMHFHFVDIPLSELVRLVFTYAEKDVIGLEQLKDMLVTAQVKDVQALDAAKVLLKCHGFKMEESGEHYQIVTDYDVNADITNSAACIVSGLE